MRLMSFKNQPVFALRLFFAFTVLGLMIANDAFAEQTFKRNANGKIAFKVSTENVTRLRFKNDRVVEIITDESAFQTKNDEQSGDVFFRRIEGADAGVERGFLITEKGVTISYQMTPVKVPVKDVVIEVSGLEKTTPNVVSNSRAVSAGTSTVPQASGYKGSIINALRDVIQSDLPKLKKRGRGRLKSIPKGDYVVDVYVVNGGTQGKTIDEVSFAKPGVIAVWAERPVLQIKQTAWLVVVRN